MNIMNEIQDTYSKAILAKGMAFMARTGLPYFVQELDLTKIEIPRFQRRVNQKRVRRIIKEFDPNLVELPVVVYNPDTGKYDVIDGQHTIIVLLELGFTSWPSRIYVSLTNEEKIKIFTSQYKKKIRLNTIDVFNAYSAGRVEPAPTIERVCDEYDVTIGGPRDSLKNITSIRKILQIFNKFGEEGLKFVLKVIEDTGWTDNKAYTEASLNIGFYAYESVKADEKKYNTLLSALTAYDTSVEFLDFVRTNNLEVSAKHPEAGVKKMIESFFK